VERYYDEVAAAGECIDDDVPLCLFPGAATHLAVVGANGRLQDPVSEGRYGCDYAWGAGCLAYRCLPHHWTPGGYVPWEDDADWEVTP